MLNADILLSPISEELPCGHDLRDRSQEANHLYHATKDARVAARNIERQLASNPELNFPRSEWQTVYKQCITILSEHAKDLEICAWLIEAAVRLDQFRGLADSIKITTAIITHYWDNIYPEPDEEGIVSRVSALGGLNGYGQPGSLIQPITAISITKGDSGPFAFWQYQKALELEKITDNKTRKQRELEIGISLDRIKADMIGSGEAFYLDLQKELLSAIESIEQFSQTLDAKAGRDAPPTSNLLEILTECKQYVMYLLPYSNYKNLFEQKNAADDPSTEEANTSPKEKKQPTIKSHIASRQEALAILDRVADYFIETEPHSPLPYLLRRAVYWGELSLPQLLQEMISDDKSLKSVCGLTGIEYESH